MAQSNPWFWHPFTNRFEFEQELRKSAVHLRDKNARVTVPKVSIEDVRARKNALAAKGVMLNNVTAVTAEPRKIK